MHQIGNRIRGEKRGGRKKEEVETVKRGATIHVHCIGELKYPHPYSEKFRYQWKMQT